MISALYLRMVALLLAMVTLATHGVYQWKNAAPAPELQNRGVNASTTMPTRSSGQSDGTATIPNDVPANPDPSLPKLHAAFREAQRCAGESVTVYMHLTNNVGTAPPLPPHNPGCDTNLKTAFRRVTDATYAAAKAGDIDAQLCFLLSSYGDRESGFALSEAEIAEYRSLAPKYVDAAFKRGDWRVVELLGFHVVDSAGLFIELEQWKDPAREYKAHQLMVLGTDHVVHQDAEYWLSSGRPSESRLSDQEIRDADAWVRETYDQYFSGQPKLMREPTVCNDTDNSG